MRPFHRQRHTIVFCYIRSQNYSQLLPGVIVVKLKVMQESIGRIQPAGLTSSAQAVFALDTSVCMLREDDEITLCF